MPTGTANRHNTPKMSTAQVPPAERAVARASRLRRVIHGLRSEGDSRTREAAAIGTGVAIGCLPFWGTHFFLCWGAGWLFRLNRLKVYFAAHLINPLVLPPLLYAEIQAGAWLQRGETHALSRSTFDSATAWGFAGDLIVGSFAVGVVLGMAVAIVTYVSRRPVADPFFRHLTRRAADRFLQSGITPWEFARGKLTGDPVYRHALLAELGGREGTLLDIGCGQGLLLALVAEAQDMAKAGTWPASHGAPPRFSRLVGIELRQRVARNGARALEGEAEILTGDVRDTGLPPADVVVIFDVLHMLPIAEQDVLLRQIRAILPPHGRLYVRDADAAARWRFATVRLGNRLKAMFNGQLMPRFAFRTADAWVAALEAAGFRAEVRPMSHGTPFGNVLLVATPDQG